MPIRYSEDRRQLEHLAPVIFAVLLKYLNWPAALALAVAAMFYGLFISPLWGTSRPGEPRISGKFYYALAVFLLLLLFRRHFEFVAAIWGILAVSDSLSNIAGRRWGRTALPWNRGKTWVGSSTFLVSGFFTFLVLAGWFVGAAAVLRPEWIWTALLVSLACALVESLPAFVDDNLLIAAAGAFFVLLVETIRLGNCHPLGSVGSAVVVNAILSLLVFLFGLVTLSGVIAGFICGSVIFWGGGWKGFLLLFAFFAIGTASTRVKQAWKEERKIAQENKGRRSARHALANCVAAALVSAGLPFSPNAIIWKAALLGAFATATFDTVSTELGQVFGKAPVLIRTGRRVPPGTEGAVSVEGTLLGLAASALVSLLAWATGFVPAILLPAVVLGATVGNLAESWIGAGRYQDESSKNEILNFYNTAIGAAVAAGTAAGILTAGR
ncbi:MAG TPA: DUF92 domain-containing protein [Acidobacteriota bacterium]|jgi:uncharacterized protein (TIGR00297 family)